MAFWSTEKFSDEQEKNPIITNYSKERLRYGRYSLRLDREVCVTPDGLNDDPKPGEGKFLRIPPGQFALLFTTESLDIPNNAMGFISVKTSEKIKGLINVSGFHVDPGFRGHLKFSVYNAGNRMICLDYESECFLLWLCSLDRTTDDTWFKKNKFMKNEISASDREQMCDKRHSPANLHNRIEKLEANVNLVISVGVVVVIPLLIAFAVPMFEHLLEPSAGNISIYKLIAVTSLVTSLFIVTILGFRNYCSKK